jgi:beta-aspartyl-dipeptidase (metallo-type)
MFILIEDGELYAPERRGRQSILVAGSEIVKVGDVDRRALEALDVECEVIDASNCCVTPGMIDPHEHLLGGSGEGSLALQSPMLFPREILRAGVTTVVGTLGVDTTMKTVQGLLGRVKALTEEGIDAYMWTGGYNVPPTTLLGSVRQDMMYVEAVIGAGEVAISDERGLNQSAQELAKLVRDTHVGGLLTGKCGLTHFHLGEERTRLAPLRDIMEQFQVKPEWLYPTHVQRNEKLLDEAIELANAGAYVDFDVVNRDLAKWLDYYLEHGGPSDKLTISSDADSSTPDILREQVRGLVLEHGHALEDVLCLVTVNPACALKLKSKGRVEAGKDADLVLLDRDSLEVRHVIARGRLVVRDGEPCFREKWLEKSARNYELVGDKWEEVEEMQRAR